MKSRDVKSVSGLLRVMICLSAAGGLPGAESVLAAPAEPETVKGQWATSGEGKAVAGGFVQEGRQPLVVSNPPVSGNTYIIHGELVLPTPAAGFQVAFKPKPTDVPAEPGKKTTLAQSARVGLGKAENSLTVGRRELPISQAKGAPIPISLVVRMNTVDVIIGPHRESITQANEASADLSLVLSSGAQVQNLSIVPLPASDMIPIVSSFLSGNVEIGRSPESMAGIHPSSLPKGVTAVGGIPFYFSESRKNAYDISKSMSGLKDPYRNGRFYTAETEDGLGRVILPASGDQYAALHLIAFSAGRPDHARRVTVRVGHYGTRANILEDVVVDVPELLAGPTNGQNNSAVAVKLADGRSGFLHHIRVPMAKTANVKEFGRYSIEFTRDMNTHIVPPDPSQYGKIPVGLPSDVVVLAATLEPSPVAMSYTTKEAGNVFHDTQKVVFNLKLENRTKQAQAVRAFANSNGPGTGEEFGIQRKQWTAEQTLQLQPGETREVALDANPTRRGWYACGVGIEVDGKIVQQRDTTYAVLAPDTRKAMGDSPFGVWEFWYPHSIAKRPDQVEMLASLINKGGWRWTYGGSPNARDEEAEPIYRRLKEQYKITWTANNLPNSYQRAAGWFDQAEFDQTVPEAIRSRMGYADPYFKVMHESRSSLAVVRRLSEFLGGEPYQMPEAEKTRLEEQFANVVKYSKAVKKANPEAKIVMFNDYPAVVDQFLSRGLPKDTVDAIGLEGAMFLRAPERQPDWMSLLGQIHQMKRSMAKYGYDIPIWTTEALYHPTEAGGLSLHQQGVIAVREAMMALQLGVSRMAAAGLIKDSSDDYHWSNWGSCGFCFRDPEINPKPSYAMYAWMTQILDQAKPAGKVAVPNTSLHVAVFKKPDGTHVYGIWTARGVQRVSLQVAGSPRVFDAYGNTVSQAAGPLMTVHASPTPQYLTDGVIEAVAAATPVEREANAGKLLLDFDKPEQVKVVEERNSVLDAAWETPRLKGEFETAHVQEDGVSALKITLKPDNDPRKLLPRYVAYELASPVVLEGRPDKFAMRVKGNSGWGRVMFEVVDAKGRIWTSCGNQYSGATNAADSLGDSFISFEGWDTIRFPVVGMYPGKDQSAMRPYNYNWWPINAPEELEIEPRNQAARAKHDEQMEQHAEAMKEYAERLKEWEKAVATAKEAGKPQPRKPAEPEAPRFQPVRNMGVWPVDYPLKLTKVLIDMRPSILYLDEERPVANPTIYLDRLGVIDPPPGQ